MLLFILHPNTVSLVVGKTETTAKRFYIRHQPTEVDGGNFVTFYFFLLCYFNHQDAETMHLKRGWLAKLLTLVTCDEIYAGYIAIVTLCLVPKIDTERTERSRRHDNHADHSMNRRLL